MKTVLKFPRSKPAFSEGDSSKNRQKNESKNEYIMKMYESDLSLSHFIRMYVLSLRLLLNQ